MDELNMRRKIYADPKGSDSEIFKNAKNSRELCELQTHLKTMDKDIEQAFKVDVPEGLEGRISLQQILPEAQQKGWQYAVMGLAASLFIAVITLQNQPVLDVGDLALQHVHEDHIEFNHQIKVSSVKVNDVLNKLGYELQQPIAGLKHVSLCQLNNGTDGAHFVVQGEKGLVTVLLMPKVKTSGIMNFNDDHYFGLTQPMLKGSIAYLSEHKNESLNALQQQFESLRVI